MEGVLNNIMVRLCKHLLNDIRVRLCKNFLNEIRVRLCNFLKQIMALIMASL